MVSAVESIGYLSCNNVKIEMQYRIFNKHICILEKVIFAYRKGVIIHRER